MCFSEPFASACERVSEAEKVCSSSTFRRYSFGQRPNILMESKCAAAGEHRGNLHIDGVEDGKGHLVARSGGLFRWFAPSLTPKLLGILLVAEQFTLASASGVSPYYHNPFRANFDLIGLITTFGTEAATKSLMYSALNDDWRYMTGHIGPGSLSVAAELFALGGTADAYKLAGLECPHGLRYIGLKSNTETPVANAVGACIVREHQSLWKGESFLDENWEEEKLLGRRKGARDARREVKVVILEVGRMQGQRVVMLKASKGGFFLLGWLPLLLTLGVILRCIICEEAFVAGLITLGSLGMFVGVLGLRLCRFEYSEPMPAKNAPDGDCLVVDDTNPDTLHVIKGTEEDIQALFQRKINYQSSLGEYFLLLAGSMLYIYVIASVFYMPSVSQKGQILFLIANLIGLVMDLVKASKNGQEAMAVKAREQFRIELKDLIVFQNRTAAVAFVARHAKDHSMLKSTKLLPSDGPVWQNWWEELAKCATKVDRHHNSAIDIASQTDPDEREFLKTLVDDMMEGLKA